MFLIDDILVSAEILNRKFVCNLKACKGACCWEGDWGAPLEDAEIQTLEKIREIIRPYLSEEGNQVIDEDGVAIFYEQPGKFGTPLVKDGSCVYLHRNESGHAVCGIELAYQDGLIDFRKPVSCHLYPVRHESEPELGFEALNYDEWEICQAACVLGESLQVPVYQFVREAIIRKFGERFYQELEAIASDLQHHSSDKG